MAILKVILLKAPAGQSMIALAGVTGTAISCRTSTTSTRSPGARSFSAAERVAADPGPPPRRCAWSMECTGFAQQCCEETR